MGCAVPPVTGDGAPRQRPLDARASIYAERLLTIDDVTDLKRPRSWHWMQVQSHCQKLTSAQAERKRRDRLNQVTVVTKVAHVNRVCGQRSSLFSRPPLRRALDTFIYIYK